MLFRSNVTGFLAGFTDFFFLAAACFLIGDLTGDFFRTAAFLGALRAAVFFADFLIFFAAVRKAFPARFAAGLFFVVFFPAAFSGLFAEALFLETFFFFAFFLTISTCPPNGIYKAMTRICTSVAYSNRD